jgi:hypothetical protein
MSGINFATNPMLLFWLSIITLITLMLWLLIVNENKFIFRENEWAFHKKSLTILSLAFILTTGFNYWSMSQQGLQSIIVNPYKAVKAAQLAPKINQISNPDNINSLSDKEKQNTIVIVYKFGCPDCQRLWLYAQKNQELLPSENVLWVPTKESNKNISELVAASTRYPSIHYWNKNDSTLEEQVIEEPTESQLTMLSKIAKEYTK